VICILGCGYVGMALGQELLKNGHHVWGVVRSEASATHLRACGLEAMQGDLASTELWKQMEPGNWRAVIYCPSTGGGGINAYRAIHERGLELALQWAPGLPFFYTSSTSVYGQQDGKWVNEASPTEPDAETAKVLVEAEQRVLQSDGIVLRLGGIYGPDRGVLLKRLLEGKAMIPPQDPKWLNLIHLEDIVGALRHGIEGHLPAGQLFNVIDDAPSSYREIYAWLCAKLNRPLPPVGTPEYLGKRGLTNKRVSNAKLKATGWQPNYPTFREGYRAALD